MCPAGSGLAEPKAHYHFFRKSSVFSPLHALSAISLPGSPGGVCSQSADSALIGFLTRRCGCLPWICPLHQQSLARSCQVTQGHCFLMTLAPAPPPPVPIQWEMATSVLPTTSVALIHNCVWGLCESCLHESRCTDANYCGY